MVLNVIYSSNAYNSLEKLKEIMEIPSHRHLKYWESIKAS